MEALRWDGEALLVLDQSRLPVETVYRRCTTSNDVAEAIAGMQVRGAPAIGAAAAFGLALGAREYRGGPEGLWAHLERVAEHLRSTRPTAVNLAWALDRLLAAVRPLGGLSPREVADRLLAEALALRQEDVEVNRRLGRAGERLIPPGARVLTHCNAGALATCGYGTALGVLRAAREAGKDFTVYAGETRPLLQGARLTALELAEEGIAVTLVTDGMAGHLMSRQKVDLVLVGADRIAANGDTANKIGTYGLAVLASHHGLPFYVAAPTSTIDLALEGGWEIPIEERSEQEVLTVLGQPVAPPGVRAYNPAFDVTPHQLITAIITEAGVIYPPFAEGLRRAAGRGELLQ